MSEKSSVISGVRPILIYDGDCAFCSSTIRLLQRFMRTHPPMEPFQFTEVSNYGLTKQECATEIKFVDLEGDIHGGEAAFKKLFFEAGGVWRLFGGLLALPMVRQASGVVYRWVAKNRHSLPGGTPTCSMPKKYEN
jgi:predicted DCC family thiol-disulfide oxidoreductase YuxK